MKLFFRTSAAVLGTALLITTPMQSYAGSFGLPSMANAEASVVENVRRRRYYRRRSNNGAGIALGIIGGLIIGGAIANSNNRSRNRDRSHVDWCYDRYRSYRASDNTFQPYRGGRRQCNSPYY
jgi:hypothetical protein